MITCIIIWNTGKSCATFQRCRLAVREPNIYLLFKNKYTFHFSSSMDTVSLENCQKRLKMSNRCTCYHPIYILTNQYVCGWVVGWSIHFKRIWEFFPLFRFDMLIEFPKCRPKKTFLYSNICLYCFVCARFISFRWIGSQYSHEKSYKSVEDWDGTFTGW